MNTQGQSRWQSILPAGLPFFGGGVFYQTSPLYGAGLIIASPTLKIFRARFDKNELVVVRNEYMRLVSLQPQFGKGFYEHWNTGNVQNNDKRETFR